jgi:acyl-CoA reductase-like NAD-dependent aldehyde dehydrogenase
MPEDAPAGPPLRSWYLPGDFTPPEPLRLRRVRLEGHVELEQPVVTPSLLHALGGHLRRAARELLRELPVARIVAAIDRAAEEWLACRAPDYEAVMRAMTAATGLSRPMVRASLVEEQTSSRAEQLWEALAAELGDPAVLDGFTEVPRGRRLPAAADDAAPAAPAAEALESSRTRGHEELPAYLAVAPESRVRRVRAFGPELVVCILPGNIPALSHLPMMRSLLVKAACLAKPAADEPVYAAAYARTLARIEPLLGRCLAVLPWPGGDPELDAAAFAQAGAVIAYGSEATCRSIARRAPEGTKLVLHGHKLGFAVLGQPPLTPTTLDDLARRLALDVAMFDQQACLSPHWIFVEQGPVKIEEIAGALSRALRDLEQELPRGRLTVEQSAAVARTWDDAELAALMEEGVQLHARRGRDRFLVLVDPRRPLQPSCLARTIRLVPVDRLENVPELVAPFREYLQNVAVAAAAPARAALAESLGRLGAARICPLGRMAFPTMTWHHDGLPCIEALVRYCDLEEGG